MKLSTEDKQKLIYWLIVTIVVFLVWFFAGCKTKTLYVPIESVKTEYKDRIQRDSIHLYDSVLVKMKGDTVWLEKYKYLYRDKLVRDSTIKTDSIQIPYPVEVEKEVNRLTSFQSFQIWCGRIMLLLIIAYFGFRYIKRFI